MAEPVEVLAIAGTGQNGATVLTRMLGRLPGFVAVGELGRLWDTGIVENRLCGCGLPFHDCPFWTRVGEVGFGGWETVDGYEVSRLREAVRLKRRLRAVPHEPITELRKIASPQLLPFLLAQSLWPAYRRNVERYAELMGRLYGAIAEVSGRGVVVDSMKVPYHVFLLRHVQVDLRVVHLVRDSHGVAHSQAKVVQKQGPTAGRYRGRRHPVKTAIRWDWVNLVFHLLSRMGVRSALVRYEDVISSPAIQLERIAELAGAAIGSDDLAFIRGPEVELPPEHLVAGNRVRMETGSIRLRVSDEWKTELPASLRRVVSLLTWPLSRRYGYSPQHRVVPAAEAEPLGRPS